MAFYETDAMGIVHHANYVKFLELARVQWLEEHHRPYRDYVERERHFAVTRVEADYKQAARFDDPLDVTVWLDWARGASLRMAYTITCRDALLVQAATEHAMVDLEGRIRRIPREDREALKALVE